MNNLLPQGLSAIKFSPPQIEPERSLPRCRVVELLLRAEERGRRIFIINAQAGQGKTNVASQYLAKSAVPFAWYQLGPEDQDPVFLFSSLLTCLGKALVGFRSPLLVQMLEKGELAATDVSRGAEMLAKDLANVLPPKFCLVFDDLHLLEGAPFSLAFIDALLYALPVGLRVVFLSRWSFPELIAGKPVEVLNNDDLALTRAEIAELYNRLLQIPLSSEMGDLLYRQTDGWIMGLVLFGQSLAREKPDDIGHRLNGLDRLQQDRAVDYFRSEILDGLEPDLKQALLKLALLDEIPVALVERITGGSQGQQLLERLVRQNLFVRLLDNGTTFTLHHLFREVLRTLATSWLSEAERQATLMQAADWHLTEGRTEEALRYFAGARDYLSVGRLLRQIGLSLLAQHRLTTLREALKQIPDPEIERYPFLAYFSGMLAMETAQLRALDFFETARLGFVSEADPIGELLATAQQVLFHIQIDGHFNEAVSLLDRAESLFADLAEKLDIVSRIQIAHILAMGYFFVSVNRVKVERYVNLAWNLAVDNNFDNLQAGIAITRGYLFVIMGDWRSFKGLAETAQALMGNLRVTAMHKLFLRLAQVNVLILERDVVNYARQRKAIEQVFCSDLLTKTVVGPLFWVLDIDMAIAENRLDEAMSLVQLTLSSDYAANNPHLRSMYLEYQAFLLALLGRREPACDALEESLRLRNETGGRLFAAVNLMILGATCVQLSMTARAEDFLGRAISACEEIDEKFARFGAYAFRGLLRLNSGRSEEGRQDIEAALRGMRANRFVHFFMATPAILESLFCAAVSLSVEADYARQLAAEQLGLALLDKGRSIPLLHVTTLGPLVVRFGARAEVREEGWSPTQRDFWARLLSSPGLCLSQEQMQLSLWPESSTEKSRANFDTLLLRIRRVLDAVCYPQKASYYLSMKNKMLCLYNCQLDAESFSERVNAGLKLFRQKKYWQAGNELYPALQTWQGRYLSNILAEDDVVEERRTNLERLYLEGALAWATILAESGAVEDAIEVISAALRYDPTSHALVKKLYGLHIHSQDSVKADAVVKNYSRALMQNGFSAEEISQTVDSLWKINV